MKIPEKESDTTEFKQSPSGLEREIVAFANQKGGSIYVGIDDRGKERPLQVTNRLLSQIQTSIHNCDPIPQCHIEESKGIIRIDILEGDNKPYKAPEGFYLRMGTNSQKLTRDEILDFYIRENRIHFDSQLFLSRPFNIESSEDCFNLEKFQLFREKAKFSGQISSEKLLINLGLIRKKEGLYYPTHALILLFASRPEFFFSQSRTILWLMASRTEILDQKVISGDLFSQLEESMQYLKINLRSAIKIEKLQHENIAEFPEFVLRELVLNALVHRDYFETGAEVQIKIFPSIIEFSNPGRLLPGVTPKSVFGHSIRRNPLLAEIFQRAGYIERAGTGLLRVQEYLKNQNLLPLMIDQDGIFFVAILTRPSLTKKKNNQSLNDRQMAMLNHLSQGERTSSTEYSRRFGITDRQARKDIAELEKAGHLHRFKKGRTVYYIRA